MLNGGFIEKPRAADIESGARMTVTTSQISPRALRPALDRQSMLLADYWRIQRKAKQLKPDQLAADIARAEARFRDRLSRSPVIIYAEGCQSRSGPTRSPR